MYRHGSPGNRDRIRHPETRRRNRPAPPDRACFAGPGAHCTAPKSSQVPKILTLSTACPFVSMPPNVRHTRDWLPEPPENAHLIEKMRHSNGHGNGSRKTSPQLSRYQKLQCLPILMHRRHLAVPGRHPPKSLTFRRESFIRQPYVSPRKFSPVPKRGTAKTRFLPVLAGFSANPTTHRSRKASPLTIFRANTVPENAHL